MLIFLSLSTGINDPKERNAKQQVVENVASVFSSTDQQSSEATERIAQLEQLVGRLTLALEIQKKALTLLD